MNKKIISVFSILFSFFVLSCNNSNNDSSSSEDVKDSKGLNNYIGNWSAVFTDGRNLDINIKAEYSIMYNNLKALSLEDLGNDRYKIKLESDNLFSVTLKFKSDTEGIVEDNSYGIGTILKKY